MLQYNKLCIIALIKTTEKLEFEITKNKNI